MEKETLKRALIAGSFSVLIIGSLSYLTYGYEYGLFLVASFGSSMVLMLGYPETPFARGRNVFTGHLLTSLAGIICHGLLIVQFDIPIYIVIPLAVGLGIFLMVSAHIYPIVLQLIPIIMRPLWFISGVVISLNSLPQWLRPYITWNPVLQAIELARHAFSTNYVIRSDEVSLLYLWQCAIVSLCFGLWIYTSNEKRLLTR